MSADNRDTGLDHTPTLAPHPTRIAPDTAVAAARAALAEAEALLAEAGRAVAAAQAALDRADANGFAPTAPTSGTLSLLRARRSAGDATLTNSPAPDGGRARPAAWRYAAHEPRDRKNP
jgi:hypothetical protein